MLYMIYHILSLNFDNGFFKLIASVLKLSMGAFQESDSV